MNKTDIIKKLNNLHPFWKHIVVITFMMLGALAGVGLGELILFIVTV